MAEITSCLVAESSFLAPRLCSEDQFCPLSITLANPVLQLYPWAQFRPSSDVAYELACPVKNMRSCQKGVFYYQLRRKTEDLFVMTQRNVAIAYWGMPHGIKDEIDLKGNVGGLDWLVSWSGG